MLAEHSRAARPPASAQTTVLFIASTKVSKVAHEFTTQVEKIVLVDGTRLTALMIDHGVGVSHRNLKVARLDNDDFEDG